MKNRLNNLDWFFIKAKDGDCVGYMPGKDKEEACLRLGLKVEECSAKRVKWSGKEFVEVDQSEQGKLL